MSHSNQIALPLLTQFFQHPKGKCTVFDCRFNPVTAPSPISLSNACSVISAPPQKHPGEILSSHQALLCQTKGIEGINPHLFHSGNVVGYQPLGNQLKNKRQSARPSKSFFIHGNQPDLDMTYCRLSASSPPPVASSTRRDTTRRGITAHLPGNIPDLYGSRATSQAIATLSNRRLCPLLRYPLTRTTPQLTPSCLASSPMIH